MTTVEWTEQGIRILDQSRLPGQEAYELLTTVEEVAEAIRGLEVRGAPLIGVVAAMGMALASSRYFGPPDLLPAEMSRAYHLLLDTRPTAVNLQWALARMMKIYQENRDLEPQTVRELLVQEAQRLQQEDVKVNRIIGDLGSELLPNRCRVLTICNAGALATCGYGTALGVIRTAFAAGKLEKVYACETRPVLQGSRLTVWELLQDDIPTTLITDNMAGYLMQLGEVDVIIAGADRIAANGDTANKIGTYSLAVLARHHGLPFYVAAPVSTMDYSLENGQAIPIETRDPEEVRKMAGTYITVPEVSVFNPAFDITPGHLITAIITEKGVIGSPYELAAI